jgi:RimJ/RimL family protein N-acetyltransferase
MPNITIRRISKEQYLVAKELRLTALKDAPYAFSTTFEQASQRSDVEWEHLAESRSEGQQDCTFLAYDGDGKAIGMAGGYRDPTNRERAHLVAMWVAPEWRGTGAAAELVETVCQWAAAIPVREITAWVTEGNDRAIRFYNRLGFVTQPDREIFPPDPSKQTLLTLRNLERKED